MQSLIRRHLKTDTVHRVSEGKGRVWAHIMCDLQRTSQGVAKEEKPDAITDGRMFNVHGGGIIVSALGVCGIEIQRESSSYFHRYCPTQIQSDSMDKVRGIPVRKRHCVRHCPECP